MSTNSFSPALVVESAAVSPKRLRTIRPASFSPSGLWQDFLDLIHYSDLIVTLSEHRIKVRYKQSSLGLFWAILQPLTLMLIYTVIFGRVAKVPSGGTPYPEFAFSALIIWTMFSTSLTNSSGSLVSHTQLVTKVFFPREILPLTYVIAAIFDFLVASLLLAGMMIWYQTPVTWNVLWAVPILLLAAAFSFALALFFSATQVRFRDIGIAMPLLLQIWMFATPVVYSLSVVPEKWRGLYSLNAMVGIVENFRRVVVQGVGPELQSLLYSAVIIAILLVLAYAYFKRSEATMADII